MIDRPCSITLATLLGSTNWFEVRLGANAIRALNGVESTALRCLTECAHRELVVRERHQQHKACGSGNVGHHEAIQVVQDRPSDDLSESSMIAFIETLERPQVGVGLLPRVVLLAALGGGRVWLSCCRGSEVVTASPQNHGCRRVDSEPQPR